MALTFGCQGFLIIGKVGNKYEIKKNVYDANSLSFANCTIPGHFHLHTTHSELL
jgi:hypothetical protein